MEFHRLRAKSPYLIIGFGAVLFLIALVHHTTEIFTINQIVGPLVAGILDGVLALGLVYAGYWLTGADLSPEGNWLIFQWCLIGATLFVLIMGFSLLVRAFEGRVIGEAIFPLLIAAEAGGLAGVITGYHTARMRVETRRAQTVSEALGFVNSLIRHDLRNDLNVIQGHAHLLENDAGLGDIETESDSPSIIAEKTDEALTRIETTGDVAETLIDETDLERIDLAEMTVEISKRIENTSNTVVTTNIPDSAPVIANKGLRSVVDNLLENAIEHNDADEPQVQVNVDTRAETVRLTVADNGPGISDEQKDRVLHPQGGTARSGGLSLVQTLVNRYGGEIWIGDNDPRGSVFIVELPRGDSGPQ